MEAVTWRRHRRCCEFVVAGEERTLHYYYAGTRNSKEMNSFYKFFLKTTVPETINDLLRQTLKLFGV
jgi:hypothetical protein